MAQQNIFPLRRLKIFGMGPQILKRFYSCIIESMLHHWLHHRLVQTVVRTAQNITGAKLPAIQNLYTMHGQRKALKIARQLHGYRTASSYFAYSPIQLDCRLSASIGLWW